MSQFSRRQEIVNHLSTVYGIDESLLDPVVSVSPTVSKFNSQLDDYYRDIVLPLITIEQDLYSYSETKQILDENIEYIQHLDELMKSYGYSRQPVHCSKLGLDFKYLNEKDNIVVKFSRSNSSKIHYIVPADTSLTYGIKAYLPNDLESVSEILQNVGLFKHLATVYNPDNAVHPTRRELINKVIYNVKEIHNVLQGSDKFPVSSLDIHSIVATWSGTISNNIVHRPTLRGSKYVCFSVELSDILVTLGDKVYLVRKEMKLAISMPLPKHKYPAYTSIENVTDLTTGENLTSLSVYRQIEAKVNLLCNYNIEFLEPNEYECIDYKEGDNSV